MDDSVNDLLKLSTMALATANAAGDVHSAPVYFAALQDSPNELQLFFFSDQGSRHAQDIAINPGAAAAIYPEATSWEDIRGLQLHGSVSLLSPGPEWEAAWQIYLAKFPFTGAMKDIIARNTLFSFQTTWVRLVDNRLGFGYKQEWILDGRK